MWKRRNSTSLPERSIMPRSHKDERAAADRFTDCYTRWSGKATVTVQREVIGADVGANGYTTVAQADVLAERLALRPEDRLLDIGAGRGWPSVYLANKTGCAAVLTDLPAVALREAVVRAGRQRVRGRCAFVLASGATLPFQRCSFDAIVHTDVL